MPNLKRIHAFVIDESDGTINGIQSHFKLVKSDYSPNLNIPNHKYHFHATFDEVHKLTQFLLGRAGVKIVKSMRKPDFAIGGFILKDTGVYDKKVKEAHNKRMLKKYKKHPDEEIDEKEADKRMYFHANVRKKK